MLLTAMSFSEIARGLAAAWLWRYYCRLLNTIHAKAEAAQPVRGFGF
jgi:hypothetical protein